MKIMVVGDKELSAAIRRAQAKSKTQTAKVLKNSIEKVSNTARRIAPKDTRFMHDNIVTRYSAQEGTVHSQAGYSGFVEFGTRKMDAQPFMRPAFYKGRQQFIKDFEDVARGLFN